MNTDYLALVIAISFGTFSVVGVMIGLLIWNRSEAKLNEIRRLIKRFDHKK